MNCILQQRVQLDSPETGISAHSCGRLQVDSEAAEDQDVFSYYHRHHHAAETALTLCLCQNSYLETSHDTAITTILSTRVRQSLCCHTSLSSSKYKGLLYDQKYMATLKSRESATDYVSKYFVEYICNLYDYLIAFQHRIEMLHGRSILQGLVTRGPVASLRPKS